MTTEPFHLPDDPPNGWRDRKGALRFYGERKFADGISLSASASVKNDARIYENGTWSDGYTVNWRVIALIEREPQGGTSLADHILMIGEMHYEGEFEATDLVTMKARFAELSSRYANLAVDQLRASLALGPQ